MIKELRDEQYESIFVSVLYSGLIDEALNSIKSLSLAALFHPSCPTAKYSYIIFMSQRTVETIALVIVKHISNIWQHL